MEERDVALEQVRVVREMIEATRQRIRGAWIPFAVFGALGVVASLSSHWLTLAGAEIWIVVPWLLFVAIGIPGSRWAMRRATDSHGTSFVGRMLVSLWNGAILALGTLWLAAVLIGDLALGSVGTSVVLGLGVFCSGRLLDYSPLTWSALLWWASALLAAWAPAYAFGFQALVIGLTYLLPAWGLYRVEQGEAHAV